MPWDKTVLHQFQAPEEIVCDTCLFGGKNQREKKPGHNILVPVKNSGDQPDKYCFWQWAYSGNGNPGGQIPWFFLFCQPD